MNQYDEYRKFATKIRIETIRELQNLGFGHIGGAMSAADLLAVLYGGTMRITPHNPQWNQRDYFIMSKGHAGPALYATLALKGYFPLEELRTINTPGTRLPSHCDRNNTPGIDVTTGSLGQGISPALGLAYGLKIKKMPNRVYLLLGDGECQEGQIWEGALFGPQHKLDNLVAFVDMNGKQGDGPVDDILSLGDLAQKFRDFGWYALDADGHDVAAIADAISLGQNQKDKPVMIVLHTEKGHGCLFAERLANPHHPNFTAADCEEAIAHLEKQL